MNKSIESMEKLRLDWQNRGMQTCDFFREESFKVSDVDDKKHTILFVVSDETVDRVNERLIAKGCQLENYNKTGKPFLWVHNRKVDNLPLGRGIWAKVIDDSVKVLTEFYVDKGNAWSEFCKTVYEMYRDDWMECVSVGFLPKKHREPTKEELEIYPILESVIPIWEMLEHSATPISANPNARQEKILQEKMMEVKEAMEDNRIIIPVSVYKDFGFEEVKEVPTVTHPVADEIPESTMTTSVDSAEIVYYKDGEIIATEKYEEEIEGIEEKPLENFHSCDISDKKYPKYRIEKCAQEHNDKCIDVNWGILGPNKSEISSLRYDIKIWTESSARSHCKSRKGKFIPATKDIKAETFNCECIECGHKLKSEKHCNELKCPKCGGKMRRVERPGPGKELEDIEITTLTNEQIKQVQSIFDNMLEKIREKESQKDYINIVDPTITLKDNPQEKTKLEKLEESEDVKKLLKELKQDCIDSFLGDFRRDYLGIVDDK